MARDDRQHKRLDLPGIGERTNGQRDHDRILYSSAFRRLANITQVVAADQSPLLHNRLTHTLKVAQLGRRLAEKLIAENRDHSLIADLGGLDADVVEAACLAHDLGHPPFGHVAEEELDALVQEARVPGGFEGNAQSFRIVTKLAARQSGVLGLDLSRATLNALLKYPWERQAAHPKKTSKWGAYSSESAELAWVRRDESPASDRRSLEAEIMDFADDVAYSIYDVEDFYRANKIPMHALFTEDKNGADTLSDEASKFFAEFFLREESKGRPVSAGGQMDYRRAFLNLREFLPRLERVFTNSREQRTLLREWTSTLVGRYLPAFKLGNPKMPGAARATVSPNERREIDILKQLIWHYVITDHGLATQQHGYREVIRTLFKALSASARGEGSHKGSYMLPVPVREALAVAKQEEKSLPEPLKPEPVVRVVVDYIASMSEQEAIALYRRLEGISFGSFQSTGGGF